MTQPPLTSQQRHWHPWRTVNKVWGNKGVINTRVPSMIFWWRDRESACDILDGHGKYVFTEYMHVYSQRFEIITSSLKDRRDITYSLPGRLMFHEIKDSGVSWEPLRKILGPSYVVPVQKMPRRRGVLYVKRKSLNIIFWRVGLCIYNRYVGGVVGCVSWYVKALSTP